MYLGIEIGGTKLQLGVGPGGGKPLVALERLAVDPADGATGILRQLEAASALVAGHDIERIGIGFGGPVDAATGTVRKSHQISGWEAVPLAAWCEQVLGRPTVIGNDCDVAALAEARYGAGKGAETVFYMTVGTGVGGGFVQRGQLYGVGRPAVAEIGHLRPGLHADRPDATVESFASGWGIAAETRSRLLHDVTRPLSAFRQRGRQPDREEVRRKLADAEEAAEEFAADLLMRCDHDLDALSTRQIAQAAAEGNEIAREVFEHAALVLGWAVAQTITLLAPETIVVGGGVASAGDALLLGPLRSAAARYVFPTLEESYQIVPAALGDEVVVHGAIAIAGG